MPAESMVSAVVVRLIHGVAVFEFVYNKGTLKDLIDALVHTAFLVKTFGVDRVRYRVPYRRSWIRFLERMNVPPRGPAMMDMEHSL